MVLVFLALNIINYISKNLVRSTQTFFAPALAFYSVWVPLFFSPPLVQLPLALQGISGDTLLRLGIVLSTGTILGLASTAAIVQTLRLYFGESAGDAKHPPATTPPARQAPVPATVTLTAGITPPAYAGPTRLSADNITILPPRVSPPVFSHLPL